MRLVIAILISPVVLIAWPILEVRRRIERRRILAEARAWRADYERAGWV